jgi:membrane-bound lytic murein transglycosylase F
MANDRDLTSLRPLRCAPLRILVIAGLSLLVGTCSQPPDVLRQIHAAGELRIATRFSPTSYYFGTQGPEGLEFELAAAFARELGVRLKVLVLPSPAAALDAVRRNRAHLAAAGLTVTRASPRIVFGPPYQRIELHVVYRQDRPRPRSPADLVGRSISVAAQSAHTEALASARRAETRLRWKAVPGADPLDLLARVARGETDVTVADSNEFALGQHFHPTLRIAFDLEGPRSLAWALPADEPELAHAVSAFFRRATGSGKLRRLVERHDASLRRLDRVDAGAFLRHIADRLPALRGHFEEAAAAIDEDWRLLAAIGYQESRWDPQAQSPTGVRGLMMLTADAAARVGVRDRGDARESIFGGARYLVEVRGKIPERIPEPDRTWLALAAYNTGFGHLEDARILAQRLGRNPDAWREVRTTLPLLAQERYYLDARRGYARGWEPVRFVENIRGYLDLLEWMTGSPEGPLVPALAAAPGS